MITAGGMKSHAELDLVNSFLQVVRRSPEKG